MGYYTDPSQNKKTKEKSGWLTPILIGIAVGVLLIIVIYPNFMGKKNRNQEQQQEGNSVNQTEVIDRDYTAVNVTTKITEVVDEVSPTVVGVTNIQNSGDFWSQQSEANEAGTGSGVIYKKDDTYAYIITNHHVVDGADALEVVLADDTSLAAELVGTDLFTDLAVLRVDGKDIHTTIKMGSSESLRVGEPAIAIGNPLGHMFAGSVTQGIISGKQRTIPQDFNNDGRPDWQAEVIQTDAAINPGNSGGALINIEGKLIGINSMKISQDVAQGIGFAIPIDIARPIIHELETTGIVTRPFLGVEIYSLDEVPKAEWHSTLQLPESVDGGVYIWNVEALSPAARAGLDRLDVIIEFGGQKMNNIVDLRKVLYQEKQIGDEVHVVYYRDGKLLEADIILGKQN